MYERFITPYNGLATGANVNNNDTINCVMFVIRTFFLLILHFYQSIVV